MAPLISVASSLSRGKKLLLICGFVIAVVKIRSEMQAIIECLSLIGKEREDTLGVDSIRQ